MSRVRFHAGAIDLELRGSEPFVLRQLKLLASLLGRVDPEALGDVAEAPAEARSATALEPAPLPPPAEAAQVAERAEAVPASAAAAPSNGGARPGGSPSTAGAEAPDDLLRFYRSFEPRDLDRQSDAALLFAYYLQQREGLFPLLIGDLIRCCIRAGVDTRNFNRTLGTLTRRGFLEAAGQGQGYRLSGQGVAAVENRM